jgi:hypothetical protein
LLLATKKGADPSEKSFYYLLLPWGKGIKGIGLYGINQIRREPYTTYICQRTGCIIKYVEEQSARCPEL